MPLVAFNVNLDTDRLEIADEQLVGGVREESVSLGDELTIVVTGVIYAVIDVDSRDLALAIGEVEWRGHGTYALPAGTWSDDGALMLALLDSVLGPDPAQPVHGEIGEVDDGDVAASHHRHVGDAPIAAYRDPTGMPAQFDPGHLLPGGGGNHTHVE